MKISEKKKALLFLAAVVVCYVISSLYMSRPLPPVLFKTVVTMTQYWQDEAGKLFLLPLIEEFQLENPKIEIRLTDSPYYDMQSELKNTAPENVPDIISVDPRWLPFLSSGGADDTDYALEDLGDYFEESKLAEELPLGRREKIMTLPLTSFVHVMYYNTRLLEAAGFNRPPKTQEDFLRYGRALVSRNSRAAFGTALSPRNHLGIRGDLLPWFRAAGIDLDDREKPPFDSEAFVQTLNFLSRMAGEKILPGKNSNQDETGKVNDFIAERSALMLASISKIGVIKEAAPELPFGISTVPVPASYSGKPLFATYTWQAGIPQKSKNKEAAFRFLSFLAGKEQNLALALAVNGIPVHRNSLLEIRKHDAFYEKLMAMMEVGEGKDGQLFFPESETLEGILRDETGKMFRGESTPEKTVRTIELEWNKVLEITG